VVRAYGPIDDHDACPDCPTVSKLLAIGAAVMTTPGITESPISSYRRAWINGCHETLTHLQAVEP